MAELPSPRAIFGLYLLIVSGVLVWIVGIILLGLVTSRMLANLEMIIRLAGM